MGKKDCFSEGAPDVPLRYALYEGGRSCRTDEKEGKTATHRARRKKMVIASRPEDGEKGEETRMGRFGRI